MASADSRSFPGSNEIFNKTHQTLTMKLGFILGCLGWLVAALLGWRNFDLLEKNSLEILNARKALETEQKNNSETSDRLKETEKSVTNLNSQLDSARQKYEKQLKQIQNESVSSAAKEAGKKDPEKVSPFIDNLLKKVESAQLLERELAKQPELEIPELSYLKETDWLAASEKLGDNPSPEQITNAIGKLTNTARTNFFFEMHSWGEKTGLWANLGQMHSVDHIKAFLRSNLEESKMPDLNVFDRYEVVPKTEQSKDLTWSIREKSLLGKDNTYWNWGLKLNSDNSIHLMQSWQKVR